jgi:flagellar export protein FliJ
MTSFRFPLERVLDWRRTELELAEARFKRQAGALAELDRQRAELEAAGIRTEIQVRQWRPVSGGDLAALGGFRLQVKVREQGLAARRAECQKELEKLQNAMLEARRRLRLLERLKERRLAEWRAAFDRELEEQAAVSYLARWPLRR